MFNLSTLDNGKTDPVDYPCPDPDKSQILVNSWRALPHITYHVSNAKVRVRQVGREREKRHQHLCKQIVAIGWIPSEEEAPAIWPRKQDARGSASQDTDGWRQSAIRKTPWRWINDILEWCDQDVKGADLMTEDKRQVEKIRGRPAQ